MKRLILIFSLLAAISLGQFPCNSVSDCNENTFCKQYTCNSDGFCEEKVLFGKSCERRCEKKGDVPFIVDIWCSSVGECDQISEISCFENEDDKCVDDICKVDNGVVSCSQKQIECPTGACSPEIGCLGCTNDNECPLPPINNSTCFRRTCRDESCGVGEIVCREVVGATTECTEYSGCIYTFTDSKTCLEKDSQVRTILLSQKTVSELSNAVFANVSIPGLYNPVITAIPTSDVRTIRIGLDNDDYIKYAELTLSIEIYTIFPDSGIDIKPLTDQPRSINGSINSKDCEAIIMGLIGPNSEYICFSFNQTYLSVKVETVQTLGGYRSKFSITNHDTSGELDLNRFRLTLPINGNTYLIGDIEICLSNPEYSDSNKNTSPIGTFIIPGIVIGALFVIGVIGLSFFLLRKRREYIILDE